MNQIFIDSTQENSTETLNIEPVDSRPTPVIHLKTIDDIRLEMAKVYREMKSQRIVTSDGTRLVYVLSQIGKMIELHEIERRIERLEHQNDSR
jgi:hypothetical protein